MGPEMLLEVFVGPSYVSIINGIYSINSNGVTDTGAQLFTLDARPITVEGYCVSTTQEVQVSIVLEVDGVIRDSIVVSNSSQGKVLTYTPSAGTHTIRVYGTIDDLQLGTFSAGSFRIPAAT